MISNLLTTSVNVRYHDTRIKSIKYMSLNSITSKIESTFSVMVIALLKYGPFFLQYRVMQELLVVQKFLHIQICIHTYTNFLYDHVRVRNCMKKYNLGLPLYFEELSKWFFKKRKIVVGHILFLELLNLLFLL